MSSEGGEEDKGAREGAGKRTLSWSGLGSPCCAAAGAMAVSMGRGGDELSGPRSSSPRRGDEDGELSALPL